MSQVVPFDWSLLLIPVISGIIGYATNWVAIKFLFYPIEFVGIRVPGLDRLTLRLPRKVQQIPGLLEGKVGWQGIIPSRAGKMGSIAVDTNIAKIGTQREFYERFDPDRIAEHLVASLEETIDGTVDRILREEHPDLWADMPQQMVSLLQRQVRSRLPAVTSRITDRIGEHIDELLDLKTMVIRHMERNPEVVNRLFLSAGDKELRFVINSGLWIGGGLGVFVIPIFVSIDAWWILPVAGASLGYVTNWIAIKLIFNPVEERRIGPFRLQGLFIKRQPEVAEIYASIVAREVVTLENVAEDLLHGRQSDRTRQIIEEEVRNEVDRTLGVMEPAARIAAGPEEYDRIREALAVESVEPVLAAMADEEFNEERAEAIEALIADRLKSLPPDEFAQTLRAAFEEDEWMLIALGAALGFVAGWLQLLVVSTV